MFDFVAHGVVTVLFIAFVLFVTFFLWVLWQVRTSIKLAIRATREAWVRARNDSYTREELYKNIAYHELRGDPKAAAYWTEILERKYPHKKN